MCKQIYFDGQKTLNPETVNVEDRKKIEEFLLFKYISHFNQINNTIKIGKIYTEDSILDSANLLIKNMTKKLTQIAAWMTPAPMEMLS